MRGSDSMIALWSGGQFERVLLASWFSSCFEMQTHRV